MILLGATIIGVLYLLALAPKAVVGKDDIDPRFTWHALAVFAVLCVIYVVV